MVCAAIVGMRENMLCAAKVMVRERSGERGVCNYSVVETEKE